MLLEVVGQFKCFSTFLKGAHMLSEVHVGLEVDGQVAHSVSLFVTIFENTLLFALFLLDSTVVDVLVKEI